MTISISIKPLNKINNTNMKLSELNPMPIYFDRYINLCDDIELIDAIKKSIDELDQFPIEKWKTIGDKTYAEGKWTIKEILQHLIDTERVFSYRALAFSRKEKQALPTFSEDEYSNESNANNRTIENLIEELKAVHYSFLYLYQSFSIDQLNTIGKGYIGEYSVASIGFCMPGHQRWHLKVIEEKYLNL